MHPSTRLPRCLEGYVEDFAGRYARDGNRPLRWTPARLDVYFDILFGLFGGGAPTTARASALAPDATADERTFAVGWDAPLGDRPAMVRADRR